MHERDARCQKPEPALMNDDVDRLIITVVHRDDAEHVNQALIAATFGTTRIDAQGGFLRRGNAVLLVGVRADQVDGAIAIIRANSSERAAADGGGSTYGIVFVVRVAGHERM